ncbi:hypothetical protein SUGI_0463490 [Cryptomeria japonica]|nr:hypothetical protein SUGI_0463490 [Cryptomeria japonica]
MEVINARFFRFIQSRITVEVLSAKILPCKSIELTLPKHPGLKYSSTSAIFLSIPIISHLQWHAFSITSSPTVEGPYGPNSNYFLRYDNLILIAGGSSDFVTQEGHPPKSGCATPTQASGHLATNCEFKTMYFEVKGLRISPLLGNESKLWRETLTVMAFIAVLLLLGFFNSLFVYPKNHNSYKKYPQWARSLFIFSTVTIGIAIAASLLACWKFKTSKVNRETREVASLEETGSTDNLLLNPEDVHYGGRPDLQA